MERLSRERFLRLREVKHRVSMGTSTIYRRMHEDKFPRSLSLGGNIVAWRESEIDRWISEQVGKVERNALGAGRGDAA